MNLAGTLEEGESLTVSEVIEAPEVVFTAPPAEAVTDGQKPPAESAPAPAPDAKPEVAKPDDEHKGSRRFERRISQAIRRAAEARAEADLLKRQIEELRQKSNPSDPDEPKLEAYSDISEYAKAVKEHAASKALKEVEAKRQGESQRQFVERLTSTWEEAVEKFTEADDFDDVVGELKPTTPLAAAVMQEHPRVAYHLAKNPAEAQRIASLGHPLAQAIEVGKLSERLAAAPPKPKAPSQAPAPIAPVTGTAANASNEPSEQDDMAAWIKKRTKQVRGGK